MWNCGIEDQSAVGGRQSAVDQAPLPTAAKRTADRRLNNLGQFLLSPSNRGQLCADELDQSGVQQ